MLKRHLNVESRGGALSIWTVYFRPRDMPQHEFVARRFVVDERGESWTDETLVANSLSELRQEFLRRGLACLSRSPNDEPHIVEVWL